MRHLYKTAKATLYQFIVGSVLAFISGVASIVIGCRGADSVDCTTNTFVSLLLVLFFVFGYAALFGMGLWAEERRNPKLALALIGCEAFVAIFFLFDAKQAPDAIDRLANAGAALLAIWVAYVAWNLFRSRGARIVTRRPKD